MATLSLQRSKERLESEGWSVWVVERWIMGLNQRMDMFNFADLVAIKTGYQGVTAVQACGEDIVGHIKKLLQGYTSDKGKVYAPNPYIKTWLECGNQYFIWAWRKRSSDGRGSRKIWKLMEIEFLVENGQVIHRLKP